MEVREFHRIRQRHQVARIPLGCFRHIHGGGVQRDRVAVLVQQFDVVQVEGRGFSAGLVFPGDHQVVARFRGKRRLEVDLHVPRVLLFHIHGPAGLVLVRVLARVAVHHAGHRIELAVRGLVHTDVKGDRGHVRQLFAGQAFDVQGDVGNSLRRDLQRLGAVVVNDLQRGCGVRVRLGGANAEESEIAVLEVERVNRLGGRPGAHTDCQHGNQQPGNDFLHGIFLL